MMWPNPGPGHADYGGFSGGGSAGFRRTLTVDHTLVPSTQTDFPVLVSITDATLKTVANGGHVQRSDGFDIGFYSDSGLTTKLKWEMEHYDGTAGTVVAWVKLTTLSAAADSGFYMSYGDTAITTDQSDPANVWTNSYLGVYHLGNGTTLSVNSSTGSNNGTNHSATATAGKIDGGGSFASASSQYIDLGNGMNPAASTLSAWVKATSFPASYNAVLARNLTSPLSFNVLYVKSNGKPAIFVVTIGGQVSVDGSGATTLSTGTWYYLASTFLSGPGVTLYVNGVSEGNVSAAVALETSAASTWIGGDPTAALPWNGQIDEARFSSVARSANWITAEYNNQSSPGTFITIGSEVPL